MCGHVGIFSSKILSGQNLNKAKEFIKEALVVDTLRGGDGTGLFSMRRNFAESHLAKLPLEAHHALSHKYFTTALSDSDYGFIGHNRKSTRGINSLANSHPFHVGDIVLAHNGTLSNHTTLTTETYTVDSEAIAAVLAKSHPKDALERLQGSYALVWYNTHFKTLSFARNEDRPLYIGMAKGGELYFYASEYGIINWIAARNEITIEKIIELPVGKIYTYHFQKEGKDWLEILDFTPKTTSTVSTYMSPNYKANNWNAYYDEDYISESKTQDSCALPQDRGSLQASTKSDSTKNTRENVDSTTHSGGSVPKVFELVGKNILVKFIAFNAYHPTGFKSSDKGKAVCKPVYLEGKIDGYTYEVEGITRENFYQLVNKPTPGTPIECKVDSVNTKNNKLKLKLIVKKIGECSYCASDIFNTENYEEYMKSTLLCKQCSQELTTTDYPL